MTMFKKKLAEEETARLKRVRDELLRLNAETEGRTDRWLDKLKASKWTAAIMASIAIVVIYFIVL